MEEELVTVRMFQTSWEAHVAKATLEEDGIRCVVYDEDAAMLAGSAVDFVKLKVPESQSERADKILLEIEDAAREGEDDGR